MSNTKKNKPTLIQQEIARQVKQNNEDKNLKLTPFRLDEKLENKLGDISDFLGLSKTTTMNSCIKYAAQHTGYFQKNRDKKIEEVPGYPLFISLRKAEFTISLETYEILKENNIDSENLIELAIIGITLLHQKLDFRKEKDNSPENDKGKKTGSQKTNNSSKNTDELSSKNKSKTPKEKETKEVE